MIAAGDVFGRLTVLKPVRDRLEYWLCRCRCGATTEVRPSNLRSGQVQSCGCLQLDRVKEVNTTHGHTINFEQSKLYAYWLETRKSLTEPSRDSYPTFGGRGIKMLPKWFDSFEAFLSDVGDRTSEGLVLRRKDADKNFVPGNMRWCSPEQSNLGKSDKVLVTINGVTKQMIEWCREYNIRKNTMHYRIKAGWTGEKLLKGGTKT